MMIPNYRIQQQLMNTDRDEEEGDTIEFLKVRLMERDREISDFQAKTKKTEFKHNRDLRELKVAEERARTLLKEEKTKCDKFVKQLRQSQEEANKLGLRLAESIKERERQVGEIRGLYNALKLQVRGYQRILPTLTFLGQINHTINDIPPYEDVFIGLREKIVQLQQTQKRFEGYRKQNEEAILTYKQNELDFQTKNNELQRVLRQMNPKMAELQHETIQLTTARNELEAAKLQLQDSLEHQRQHCIQLQAALRESQLRSEQLQRQFSCQLQNKEQEIQALTQQQFQRYENQIRGLEERIQAKDKMYLQQIQLLEEEAYYLQNRMAQEKDVFEESFLQIKTQIETMQERIQRERNEQQQLKTRYDETVRSLVSSAKIKEQLQLKLQTLQRKNESYQFQRRLSNSGKAVPDIQMSQIQNLQEKYDDLFEQFEEKQLLVDKLQEQNALLQEQASALRIEVISKTTPQPHKLELPAYFLEFDQTWKKQSNQSQRSQSNPLESKREDQTQKQLKQQLKKSKQEVSTLTKKINSLQSQLTNLSKQNQQIQEQLTKKIILNEQISNQKIDLNKENHQFIQQIGLLKQKIEKLNRKVKDNEIQFNSQSNNINLLKNRLQATQQQHKRLTEELKKEKETCKALKEELKQIKEDGSKQVEKLSSKLKEQNQLVEAIKQQNQKIKFEGIAKQKTLSQEISKLSSTLQLQQKKISHTAILQQSIHKLEQQIQSLFQNNTKLTNENASLKTELNKTSDDLKKRQREVTCLAEALTRQRKERTLKSVPSLPVFAQNTQIQSSNQVYQMMIDKDNKIHELQRQVSDLRQEIQGLKITQIAKLQGIETQHNYYIQTIIDMKMKCAQSQMKAAECQYLYSQFKRKYTSKNTN